MVDVLFLLQPCIKNGKVSEFQAEDGYLQASFVPPGTAGSPYRVSNMCSFFTK
jgi:hypothetical protein